MQGVLCLKLMVRGTERRRAYAPKTTHALHITANKLHGLNDSLLRECWIPNLVPDIDLY